MTTFLEVAYNVPSINKGKNILITPNIPEGKLNNAVKAFKCEDAYKSIFTLPSIICLSSDSMLLTHICRLYA